MSLIKKIDDLLKKKSPIREFIPDPSKINLYFIGLENNKMFLYPSYEKHDNQIMEDCSKLYEYARVYNPQSVIFKIQDVDLFDIDKIVKMFMQMFGIDETRGGSYVDLELPEFQRLALDKELFTATENFVKANAELLIST
jgi:hypothetical protein